MNKLQYYVLPKEEVLSYCSSTDIEIVPSLNKYKNKLTNFILDLLFKYNCIVRKELKYKNTVSYDTITINLDDVVDALDEYNYQLYNRFNLKPKIIVVGREVYYKLTKHCLRNPYYINLNTENLVKQYWNCKLFMCPYIEGIFVLPEST